jgi:hypothetical protein
MPRGRSSAHLGELIGKHLGVVIAHVTEAVRAGLLADLAELLNTRAETAPRRPARPRKIFPCIKPGCGKPSKGPRFHYLCADHLGASKDEVASWRLESSKGKSRPAKKTNIRPCIKPGCGKPSKGPRFHYLCAEHMKAPSAEWKAWKAAASSGKSRKPKRAARPRRRARAKK